MQDPLYVGLMNDSFPPQIDGVANAVMNYADVITQKYGKALVAAPYYPDAPDDRFPYRVVRYQSIDVTDWVGYRAGNPLDPKAIDTISKEPLHILHAHCPVTAVMLGRALRETMNIPMVFTYHTKFDIDIRNAISQKLLQEAAIHALVRNIESCDDVWVVSRGAGENLRSLGYKGEYTVMENGVDVPKGRASVEAVDALRTEYGLDANVPTFLFVGRLMWYKGIRITLDALRIVKTEGKRFKMLFVGGGADAEEMQAYAKELGIADECLFTGPIRDREKLRAVYSLADLFLFPSTFDTNGLVVREAAASGLGSVLIANSCAAEGVTDGQNGLLIEENADAMAKALLSIMDNPNAMHAIGDRAMDELYVSWETSVDNAVLRYREVIRDTKALKFHPFRPDDRFYAGLGSVFNAVQKMRGYYELATEQRTALLDDAEDRAEAHKAQKRERREALIDQVLERREALTERMKERGNRLITRALGLDDLYIDEKGKTAPKP